MSQNGDYGAMGRQYLQAESYGVAAFCLYRAILENKENASAWNGLILALTFMRKEYDVQTVLARFALQPQLPYDPDMISFAMMMWQNNPRALGEWMAAVSRMRGTGEHKAMLTGLEADLKKAYGDLVEQHGEETLQEKGMIPLAEYAARRIELDWIHEGGSVDTIYNNAKEWIEDPEQALSCVRLLCMLPDPRSEKLLRRVCRNEELDSKVRTHALLALRWLGIRGNVKFHNFGESFVVNLDNPQPELTVSVPAVFKPALNRMMLWVAKEQGHVTADEYEAAASTDEPEFSDELAEKVKNAELPSLLQEVVHTLIRAAYDKYYPLVPTIRGTRDWAAAFLMLMKDYAVGVGMGWPLGEPEQIEQAVLHRNWLLSGSPDFYETLQSVHA
ncbi:HEAT repeat domain-containing protein [Paenibacillus validus]|uniref:HEAT repeat domain-containing protein n=1 Tax=Paenibacillus validus TaxID=44253 RepID=A0A7X3CSW0_9BACL|nr:MULTISPECIES: HEAT repeat domain-containing protein [Paenibacillus]MED4604121.1 HEAT repeat domain-containing protein [Paenibacillus validus]MED4605787.1 HEAT repeat domain-containing protein [Paenibacillus validus]MUG70422.1 HEAT repeat domain-containing protein [Paenibacillus validus]